MREYVKIYCCADCIHYDMKKHRCRRGANDEGTGRESFYRDCPIGIHTESEEPRTGHWVGTDDYPCEDWECDRCGCTICADEDVPYKFHFCPNCGADMQESEEEL